MLNRPSGLPDMGAVMALMRQGHAAQATAALQAQLGAGMQGMAGAPRTDDAAPDGTQRLSYSGRWGSRDYLMVTPDQPAARPAAVVLLHGCTQSAADFLRGTRMAKVAGQRGAHVIVPEQVAEANAMRCWNWFDPAHQQANAGEPALLADLIGTALQRAGLEGADVFIAGLSAGGAMAAVLAQTHPGLMLAVGVHSGLPYGAADSMPSAMGAMKQGPARPVVWNGVPMIVFHGDADRTVAPANGAAFAAALGTGTQYKGTSPGGMAWTAQKTPRGESWKVHGLGHAWSGGDAGGSYTEPAGPDASAEMMRFFWEKRV